MIYDEISAGGEADAVGWRRGIRERLWLVHTIFSINNNLYAQL